MLDTGPNQHREEAMIGRSTSRINYVVQSTKTNSRYTNSDTQQRFNKCVNMFGHLSVILDSDD